MSATAKRTRSRDEAIAEFGAAFKAAMAAVRRLRGRDTHRPGELGFAHYQLLASLAERDWLSSGDLAVAAELSPASVSQLLDTLAESGLVERTRSERDRRVVTCKLTARGRQLFAKRRAFFEKRWQEALASFTTQELTIATTVLERMQSLFDDFGRTT